MLIDDGAVGNGEAIWRKLPGLFVPNYAHSMWEYRCAAMNTGSGFEITNIDYPMFSGEAARSAYNREHPQALLGPAYEWHAAFAIIKLRKLR